MQSRCVRFGNQNVEIALTAQPLGVSDQVVTAKAFLVVKDELEEMNLEIEGGTEDGAVQRMLNLLKKRGYDNGQEVPCR